jgi:hypothetical protein
MKNGRGKGFYFVAVAFAGGLFATGTFDAVGGGGGGTLRGEIDGKSRHDYKKNEGWENSEREKSLIKFVLG